MIWTGTVQIQERKKRGTSSRGGLCFESVLQPGTLGDSEAKEEEPSDGLGTPQSTDRGPVDPEACRYMKGK